MTTIQITEYSVGRGYYKRYENVPLVDAKRRSQYQNVEIVELQANFDVTKM